MYTHQITYPAFKNAAKEALLEISDINSPQLHSIISKEVEILKAQSFKPN
jgi:hypothetical protein